MVHEVHIKWLDEGPTSGQERELIILTGRRMQLEPLRIDHALTALHDQKCSTGLPVVVIDLVTDEVICSTRCMHMRLLTFGWKFGQLG